MVQDTHEKVSDNDTIEDEPKEGFKPSPTHNWEGEKNESRYFYDDGTNTYFW